MDSFFGLAGSAAAGTGFTVGAVGVGLVATALPVVAAGWPGFDPTGALVPGVEAAAAGASLVAGAAPARAESAMPWATRSTELQPIKDTATATKIPTNVCDFIQGPGVFVRSYDFLVKNLQKVFFRNALQTTQQTL